MGTLIRSTDWSKTALGPVDEWPSSLLPMVGTEHPAILGRPCQENWPETWDVLGPFLQSVLDTGKAIAMENLPLPLERDGYLEETYFSFSFDPIRDDHGRVGGVFSTCRETTRQVLQERRLRMKYASLAESSLVRMSYDSILPGGRCFSSRLRAGRFESRYPW